MNPIHHFIGALAGIAATLPLTCAAKVSLHSLSTEMAREPLGIECDAPRFSWKISGDEPDIRQTGYRIIVSSSPELLAADQGDLWDSGEVASAESIYIPYSGKSLEPATRYWWKACAGTSRGDTDWSAPTIFQTGITGGERDWQAQWIGGAMAGDSLMHSVPARYLRKTFDAGDREVSYASLYIAGLGLYEPYLNGQKLSDGVLLQAPTVYDRIVRYDVHDATDLLRRGTNTLGVILGNGRYSPERIASMRWFGAPRLLARLEIVYTDGSRSAVVSDGSWRISTEGPVRANSEFAGEIYDARRELAFDGWAENGYDDSAWQPARAAGRPGGRLACQLNEPIRITRGVMPVSVRQTRPGAYVLDMGENMVGRLACKFRGGKAGCPVRIRFAESLAPDGSLYTDNLRTATCEDMYIFKGRGEESWQPRFTYRGFRYAEITGLDYAPSDNEFMGMVIHDDLPVTGHFATSDPVLNQVYANACRGIFGNYRGMPTDCPQRDERLGWLGDRTTGALGEAYLCRNHLFYDKWLDDIRSTQKVNGGITDIAPNYWDCFPDDVTWPAAWFTVADMLYRQYGDPEPIRRNFPAMKRWLSHMVADHMADGIISRDEHGDWCVPPESLELIHTRDSTRITPGALLATSHIYLIMQLMGDFALIAGQPAYADSLRADAGRVRDAFNARFFDPGRGCYANNTVTANLLPLRLGMVPEGREADVVSHIVDRTEGDFGGHVSVGVMGIQHLMRGLTEHGHIDLAMRIASATDYPSWGYMASRGATTIWELWNGDTAAPDMNSANHVMLIGDLLLWEYAYLGGIANAEGSTGFRRIRLKPHIPSSLDSVDCSYESVYGTIRSAWRKDSGRLHWTFTIPANTTAEVWIPGAAGSYDKKEYPSGTYTITSSL